MLVFTVEIQTNSGIAYGRMGCSLNGIVKDVHNQAAKLCVVKRKLFRSTCPGDFCMNSFFCGNGQFSIDDNIEHFVPACNNRADILDLIH